MGTFLAVVPSSRVRAFTLRGNLTTCFRLFSQPLRAPFQLSFRVLVRYRTHHVFRLGGSAPPYWVGNSGPAYSFPASQRTLAYGAVALFRLLFQASSAVYVEALAVPHLPSLSGRNSAWPLPVSIAFTTGIAVAFFSCTYYDASLQCVGPREPVFPRVPVQARSFAGSVSRVTRFYRVAKSHSEISGS